MKKQNKSHSVIFKSIKDLAFAAMLTSLAVVIGILCKSMLNFGMGLYRITFENLPIILAGLIYGPVVGGIVGVIADLISYLLSPQTQPPNLIVTLGAFAVGFLSGFIGKYVIKKPGYKQIIASGAVAHIVGSMIIKPIGLFAFFSWAVLWRIPMYLVIAPVEISLICLMYKNEAIRKIMMTRAGGRAVNGEREEGRNR